MEAKRLDTFIRSSLDIEISNFKEFWQFTDQGLKNYVKMTIKINSRNNPIKIEIDKEEITDYETFVKMLRKKIPKRYFK